MNPVLAITVEGTKATATGTVSVGEKIDVSVIGLNAETIPDFGSSDGHTGKSLRLRIVDTEGHDLARFPLEDDDSWTVTEDSMSAKDVNLDTVGMRDRFRGVSYGDKLQFGIILDSSVDSAQYARGKAYVQQWAMCSLEDPKVLPDWRDVLSKLESDLASVSEKSSAATSAASAAVSAKESASGYSSQAQASALSASSASASATSAAERASGIADSLSESVATAVEAAGNASESATEAATHASSAASSAETAESVLSASVKKSGDTMTGTLAVPSVTLNGSDLAGLISAAEASAESAAQAMVSEEAESRENADEVLSTTMAEEVQDRKDADLALAAGISTERARAEGAELTLTTNLASEVSRATGAEAELRQLISGELKMLVVDSLPSTGVEKTIYLVPAQSSKTGNVKDEYLWVNNAWEKIGSTEVDLTPYLKKDWVTSPDKKSATGEAADSRATYLLLNGKLNRDEVVAPASGLDGYAADAEETWNALQDRVSDEGDKMYGSLTVSSAEKGSSAVIQEKVTVIGNSSIEIKTLNSSGSSAASVTSDKLSLGSVSSGVDYYSDKIVAKGLGKSFTMNFPKSSSPEKSGTIAMTSQVPTGYVSGVSVSNGKICVSTISGAGNIDALPDEVVTEFDAPSSSYIANSSSKIDAAGNVYVKGGNSWTRTAPSSLKYTYIGLSGGWYSWRSGTDANNIVKYQPSSGSVYYTIDGSTYATTTDSGLDPTSATSFTSRQVTVRINGIDHKLSFTAVGDWESDDKLVKESTAQYSKSESPSDRKVAVYTMSSSLTGIILPTPSASAVTDFVVIINCPSDVEVPAGFSFAGTVKWRDGEAVAPEAGYTMVYGFTAYDASGYVASGAKYQIPTGD